MGRKLRLLSCALVCSIALAALVVSRVNAELSIDTVIKECENKTAVMGRDGDGTAFKVGERIARECERLLEGALYVLVIGKFICVSEKQLPPDFLLSVVSTYQTQKKPHTNDAQQIIEASFKRAFSCAN